MIAKKTTKEVGNRVTTTKKKMSAGLTEREKVKMEKSEIFTTDITPKERENPFTLFDYIWDEMDEIEARNERIYSSKEIKELLAEDKNV